MHEEQKRQDSKKRHFRQDGLDYMRMMSRASSAKTNIKTRQHLMESRLHEGSDTGMTGPMERAMESSDAGISDGSDTEHTGAYTVCKRSSKNSYDRSDNGYDKDKGIICHRFFS